MQPWRFPGVSFVDLMMTLLAVLIILASLVVLVGTDGGADGSA